MASINWQSIFDEVFPQPGASEDEIATIIGDLLQPLSRHEIEQIEAKHSQLSKHLEALSPALGVPCVFQWGDCTKWQLPRGTLPESYLAFLRWSNGGAFRKGAKWFDPVFRTDELRGFLLSYDLPGLMPGVLPFAFDGGGTFYVFDMRESALDGEYPVLVAHASNLGFRASRLIGTTFLEACLADADPMQG